ncbi:hypothetical protein THAOC_06759 [Thalassiosira oceanica]|uniref:Uncharacterized protein n=1 Tax=Thalassiosira oceanica TaxID=159749 RepID=K0T1Y1_THAOC|nr:hypothetical protein THAOC_06759 [Thalassiosira oceanica]|eukprot:EJK71770.1 hypothetical protein THAOC_06759 [Thalassiosira oceanica]
MIRVRRHPSAAKPTTSTCHQAMGQSGRDRDSEDSNCIYWDRKGLGTGPDVYLHRFGGLGPDLAAANVLGDCLRGDTYASPLLFQAGDRVWTAEARGEATVPGNELEAGPPADRVAPQQPAKRHLLRRGSSLNQEPDTEQKHRARTAARHAVLLAVQEAAEASAARGRAPGGGRELLWDEDIEIYQLLRHVTQGGSQTPRATQDGSQTHHAGDKAQLWELSMAFDFAPSRGYIHFHSIYPLTVNTMQ